MSLAQRSQELRSHYGEPDIERFTAASDIGLTVEYGSDGLACQIVIERKQFLLHDKQAEKYMKPEAASKLIEEIAPPAVRGREVNTILELFGRVRSFKARTRESRYSRIQTSSLSHQPIRPNSQVRLTSTRKCRIIWLGPDLSCRLRRSTQHFFN